MLNALTHRQRLLFFCALIAIYLLSWHVQNQLLIKGDVSWLMHISASVLAGGDYGKDFFEINPPLIFYLYAPAVLLAKGIGWSFIIAVRVYIFVLATISLALCARLMYKMLGKKHPTMLIELLLMLAIVFLLIPLLEFGQREQLLLLLTFPYYLVIAYRLQGGKLSLLLASVIGLLAGIGFAIKPFFLMTPFLLESYFCYQQHRLFAFWRIESGFILLVLLVYTAALWVFYQNYLQIIVPLATQFYYQQFGFSLFVTLFIPFIMGCHIPFYLYFCFNQKSSYPALGTVWIIVLASFILIYALQQIPWYYHYLPALSTTFLLLTLYFSDICCWAAHKTLSSTYAQPTRFLLWCVCVLAASALCLLGVTYYGDMALWYGLVLFVLASAFFVMRLFTPYFLLLTMVLAFSLPCIQTYLIYRAGVNQRNAMNGLISYLKENYAQQPVYFFSSYAAYMISVFEHAQVVCASRLQFLAWLRGADEQSSPKGNDYFINVLVEDLNRNKPRLILIDRGQYRLYQHNGAFDFIRYFSRDEKFRLAWQPYHYQSTLTDKTHYRFDLYTRS